METEEKVGKIDVLKTKVDTAFNQITTLGAMTCAAMPSRVAINPSKGIKSMQHLRISLTVAAMNIRILADDGAGICEDELYRATFESEQFDEEFDKSVSRFERRLESKTSWLLGQKNS